MDFIQRDPLINNSKIREGTSSDLSAHVSKVEACLAHWRGANYSGFVYWKISSSKIVWHSIDSRDFSLKPYQISIELNWWNYCNWFSNRYLNFGAASQQAYYIRRTLRSWRRECTAASWRRTVLQSTQQQMSLAGGSTRNVNTAWRQTSNIC